MPHRKTWLPLETFKERFGDLTTLGSKGGSKTTWQKVRKRGQEHAMDLSILLRGTVSPREGNEGLGRKKETLECIHSEENVAQTVPFIHSST